MQKYNFNSLSLIVDDILANSRETGSAEMVEVLFLVM